MLLLNVPYHPRDQASWELNTAYQLIKLLTAREWKCCSAPSTRMLWSSTCLTGQRRYTEPQRTTPLEVQTVSLPAFIGPEKTKHLGGVT